MARSQKDAIHQFLKWVWNLIYSSICKHHKLHSNNGNKNFIYITLYIYLYNWLRTHNHGMIKKWEWLIYTVSSILEWIDGKKYPHLSVWKVNITIWVSTQNDHNIYMHLRICLLNYYIQQYFMGCNNDLYMPWIYPAMRYLATTHATNLLSITVMVTQCVTLCVICRLLHIVSHIYIIVPNNSVR